MPRRTYRYSATYEFERYSPETLTGETQQHQHHLAAMAAVKALRQAQPNRQPSSLVVVLEIERTGA